MASMKNFFGSVAHLRIEAYDSMKALTPLTQLSARGIAGFGGIQGLRKATQLMDIHFLRIRESHGK